MHHPELFPLGLLLMMFSAIPGLLLGRRITSGKTALSCLALFVASGAAAWFFRHSVDIEYFAFLFAPPLLFFGLFMGSNLRRMDDSLQAYRRRCLEEQYKQLEADRKCANRLVAADTLAAIAKLHTSVNEPDKAVEAYERAAEIYAVEKGRHPTLTAFYMDYSAACRRIKRNDDAEQLNAMASECAPKVNL